MHASINGKEILKGINLTVNPGEIHALMGQNGAGKSTLSNVLVGNPSYEVTSGSVTFNGKDLLAMKPEERAHEGLFLSFQQPVEIPGVSMVNFMRAAINAKRKYHGMEPMSAGDFLKMMREKRKVVELDSKLANRSVNEGFSGGEKKRNEIFQMAMLEPKLSILDETDWMWMPCVSWPKVSTNCVRRKLRLWSSPITNVCWTTSSRMWCTCCSADAS